MRAHNRNQAHSLRLTAEGQMDSWFFLASPHNEEVQIETFQIKPRSPILGLLALWVQRQWRGEEVAFGSSCSDPAEGWLSGVLAHGLLLGEGP